MAEGSTSGAARLPGWQGMSSHWRGCSEPEGARLEDPRWTLKDVLLQAADDQRARALGGRQASLAVRRRGRLDGRWRGWERGEGSGRRRDVRFQLRGSRSGRGETEEALRLKSARRHRHRIWGWRKREQLQALDACAELPKKWSGCSNRHGGGCWSPGRVYREFWRAADGDSRWLADKAGQTRARWRRPPGCVYLPWPLLCTDDLVVTALWEELFRKDSHGWERQDDGWHLERWTLGRP